MTKNPTCPKCSKNLKVPGHGYCAECRNKMHRDRYRRLRAEAGHTVYGKDERNADSQAQMQLEEARILAEAEEYRKRMADAQELLGQPQTLEDKEFLHEWERLERTYGPPPSRVTDRRYTGTEDRESPTDPM